jgi:hypothetical protein
MLANDEQWLLDGSCSERRKRKYSRTACKVHRERSHAEIIGAMIKHNPAVGVLLATLAAREAGH